ncbi:protein TIFY 3B-like [Nicotiana sylvestris]|uniref:Protein TIFY n=1 Tax=Nicotiana sylvestris TaxID=4096 RepID=A0A1U7YRT4_NICSY|nr:PREDICTED: protein TIFY 3B-like [Nicotiana sylvestris]
MYCSSKVANNFLKIEKFNKNFDSQKQINESKLKGIGNNGSHRRMSALELAILPGIMHDTQLPVSQREKSESEQLTIFYAGIVHVYDNLPVEKAQSIMDFARESSLFSGSTNVKFPPKEAEPTQISQVPFACKFQAELPIARRKSLKRFFEKRHNRIISKHPYASPVITQHEDECDDQSGNYSLKEKNS